MRAFVEDAAAQRAELIAFPEMCITGYWHVRNMSREDVDALAEPIPSGREIFGREVVRAVSDSGAPEQTADY